MADYRVVFVGGIWQPLDRFKDFVNESNMPGFFIHPAKQQSHDLLRLIRIKFLGKTDPFARQLAASMADIESEFTIFALSQGVLAIVNAIRHHGMSNCHKFIFFSPPVSYFSIRRAIPVDRFSTSVPWFDASSVWAPTYHPFKFLSGWIDLACKACRHEMRSFRFHYALHLLKQKYPNSRIKVKLNTKSRTADIKIEERGKSNDDD